MQEKDLGRRGAERRRVSVFLSLAAGVWIFIHKAGLGMTGASCLYSYFICLHTHNLQS